MPSWFSSLDSVVRAHSFASWLAIISTGVAVASVLVTYILSTQANTLRNQSSAPSQPRIESLAPPEEAITPGAIESESRPAAPDPPDEELEAEVARLRRELDQVSQDLEAERFRTQAAVEGVQEANQRAGAAEAKSADAIERADEAERRAQNFENQLRDLETESVEPGVLVEKNRLKLLRALSGKPVGKIVLLAVSGDTVSANLAASLERVLTDAGWTAEIQTAIFRTPPEGLSFVVNSRETMPEYTSTLAVALAIIDLMPMPSQVRTNVNRPAGFLGLVVGRPAE